MKKNILVSVFYFLIQSMSFGQLDQLIGALTESGSIVYTSEASSAAKRKDVRGKKVFKANEPIFASIFMKQLFSRLSLDNKDGLETFRLKVTLLSNRTKYVILDIPISDAEKQQKHMCFEFIPSSLSLDNSNHVELTKLMEPLSAERHEFQISILEKEFVEGYVTIDMSNGKGVFQDLLDEMASIERKKQEAAEKERLAKEEEKQRKAAERQKKIDAYNAQPDFLFMNFKNDSEFGVSLYIETDNEETDRRVTVYGNRTQKVRCRPGEKIYAGRKMIHTVDKNSSNKPMDVTIANIKIFSISTKWSGDNAWTEWIINTSVGDWTMSTKWSGDHAWREWDISTTGPDWGIIAKWSGPDSWTNWIFTGSKNEIYMDTKWSGDNAWTDWNITSKMGEMYVTTKWSGDNAWTDWDISSKFGEMNMTTKWSGDNAWTEWEITDKMKNAPASLKMAAVFTCIIGGLRP